MTDSEIERLNDPKQLMTPMAQWLASHQVELMPGLSGCFASVAELAAIEKQSRAAALEARDLAPSSMTGGVQSEKERQR